MNKQEYSTLIAAMATHMYTGWSVKGIADEALRHTSVVHAKELARLAGVSEPKD